MKKKETLIIKPGSSNSYSHPIIHIHGQGRFTYLWIGNDTPDDVRRFGTVDGCETLRAFAKTILYHLPAKKKSK